MKPSSLNTNWSLSRLWLWLCILMTAPLPVAEIYSGENWTANRVKCKYSVRDVGFVNVHAFSWQLTLLKPLSLSTEDFEKLDGEIKSTLKRTNVHHVWVENDSKEWMEKAKQAAPDNSRDPWAGVLSNTRGEHFQMFASPNSDLKATVSELVDSPFRRRILENCGDSLCNLVLIESSDPNKNATSQKLLQEAIARLEKQMWELEKPTDKPPKGLVLSQEQAQTEKWFLKSLGLKSGKLEEPVFAILYGQGRRLGELIPLSEAKLEKLIGRAAVCGGDCECELDRDWLYGHQFVHLWTDELEKKADLTLTFDPHAAYVRSEVAAIVRKPGRNVQPGQSIDLGPGLIIHDLEPLEKKTNSTRTAQEQEKQNNELNSKLAAGSDSNSETTQTDQKPDSTISETNKKANSDDRKPIQVPSTLILVLLVVIGLTFIWSMTRGS